MQPLRMTRPGLELPPGQDFWTSFQSDGEKPIFTIEQVAKTFFGRSKLWLQRRIYAGDTDLDGEGNTIPRSNSGQYQVQLAHVERMAHSLFKRGKIDLKVFENCLLIVKLIASNYDLIGA